MITEDYVNYETAIEMKEKEFDQNCATYYLDGQVWRHYHGEVIPKGKQIYAAPTQAVAMKWLREIHKLYITILWDCGAYIGKNSFRYHIDRMDNYEDEGYNKIGFDSNEEACEAAIKYCLENLI